MPENSISPKVSIIIPTYNREDYICKTIESIRNQTYPDWELIIVDDCSKDNTVQLITQINDERVKLYKTASRLGITGTRNEGLRKVNGELIAFIDSDDLWAPVKLQKQVDAFDQYPQAGFSMTGGFNFRKLNEPLEFFYKQREGLKYDDLLTSFFKSEVSATISSLMFRKQCLNVTGFFKEEKFFAEVDFILELARRYKGIILYESLFYRRLHDSNVSSREWEKGYAEGIEMIRSYKNLLPSGIAGDALFRLHINTGEKYLLYKQKGEAIRQFFKAWKSKPFSIIPLRKIAKTGLRYFK